MDRPEQWGWPQNTTRWRSRLLGLPSARKYRNTEQDIHHILHKEEAEGRIKTDQADRQSLHDTLDVCIDPLDYASQPDGALMNIVTGQIAHPDVNVDTAVSLGHRAMENFKGG